MDGVTFGEVVNALTVIVLPLTFAYFKYRQNENEANIRVMQAEITGLRFELERRDGVIHAQAIQIKEQAEQINTLQLQMNDELRKQAGSRGRF